MGQGRPEAGFGISTGLALHFCVVRILFFRAYEGFCGVLPFATRVWLPPG